MSENIQNNEEQLDENHLIAIRKEKLKELQEQGKNPFEITKYNRTHLSREIKDNYAKLEGKDVSVAGRIMAKR
ncbi:MAG: lysine--tRNA ligase, partial [Clostridia bacterium]|nr:lysine--tRNA ligase [Clostridia bacterium]